MPPDKLTKLQTILKEINDGITRQEFVDSFKQVIAVVKNIKDTNSSEWKLIHEAMQRIPDKMMSEMMSSMSATEKKMTKDCISMCDKMCTEMDKRHSQEIAKMKLEVGMIKADREAIIEDALARIPEDPEETPEELRDKLETLRGGNRIDKSAVKGVDEELKKLDERIVAIPKVGGFRANNAVKFHDLSSQTNGTLKVFKVPKSVAAIVISSDLLPSILMEGNGFTMNGARTQLTLTTANAPSTGSQLLFQYSSMFNV